MAWKVRKFRELTEVEAFLNGAIRGGIDISPWAQDIKGPGGGRNVAPVLVGKTLIFTTPNKTVTFSAGADPAGRLTAAEILSQINAGGQLAAKLFDGALVIAEGTPSTGTVLSKNGTANPLLGFDTAVDTAGKVYGSPYITPPVAPYFAYAYISDENMHVVYVLE